MVDALTQIGIALQQPTLPWASAMDTVTHARSSPRRHEQHCGHVHASMPTPSLLFCSSLVQLLFMSGVVVRDVGLRTFGRRHLLGKHVASRCHCNASGNGAWQAQVCSCLSV